MAGSASSVSECLPRHTLSVSVAMHLFPGLAALTAYGAAAQVAPSFGLPMPLVELAVLGVVLAAIELGHLAIVARRAGSWKSWVVNPFQRPLRAWQYALVTAGLLVAAMTLYVLVAPIDNWLTHACFNRLPSWFGLKDMADYHNIGPVMLVVYLFFGIAMNIIVPTAEELYYRAYLMPRTPGPRYLSPILSTFLFSVAHFWQPNNWISIFFSVTPLAYAVLLLKNVRIAIYTHIVLNMIGFAPSALDLIRTVH